jgi:hypothetical protein
MNAIQEASAKQRWFIGHLLFDSKEPEAVTIAQQISDSIVGSMNKEKTFCSESLKFMPASMASAIIDGLLKKNFRLAALLLFDYLNIDYAKR